MKGCEKFQENLNHGFRFGLPKNGEITLSGKEGQNFIGFSSISLGFFCLKDKFLGQKTDTAVSSPATFGGTELETKS